MKNRYDFEDDEETPSSSFLGEEAKRRRTRPSSKEAMRLPSPDIQYARVFFLIVG